VSGTLEVEVAGLDRVPDGPREDEVAELCRLAAASAAVGDGHLAVAFVGAGAIRGLNRDHRGRDAATDVLAFPVDGTGSTAGPRELGDVVICPELAADVREAVVHGTLHLVGMDHEADDGEMLALQAEILRWSA